MIRVITWSCDHNDDTCTINTCLSLTEGNIKEFLVYSGSVDSSVISMSTYCAYTHMHICMYVSAYVGVYVYMYMTGFG